MISARLGPMPGNLAAGIEVARRDLLVEPADLRGGGAEAVGRIALGARDAVDGADHGGGGGRGGDGAVVGRSSEAAHGVDDALLDILLQAMQLASLGWILLEENFGQAQRAELLRERLRHAAALAQDQLGAAAADVDHEDALGMRPSALHAQVNQARLLLAGDHLDGRRESFEARAQEFLLVDGVAQGAGSHGADSHDAGGL